MNKVMKKKLRSAFRVFIQIFFFILTPAAFTSAFSGVKYIFTQLHNHEPIQLTAFVSVLIGLLLFTVIFGRFFCGFACAFGTLGDFIYYISQWIQKKVNKKLPVFSIKATRRLQRIKYAVLIIIVILCLTGLYEKTKGYSPWDVFAMITTGKLYIKGYEAGIVLLILILIGMCVKERFFCQFLCPMGAVFTMMPILPIAVLRRNRETCIKNCNACERKCPVHLSINGDSSFSGECFRCGQCNDACPKPVTNIHTGIRAIKGNEWFLSLMKGLIFLLICLSTGIVRKLF